MWEDIQRGIKKLIINLVLIFMCFYNYIRCNLIETVEINFFICIFIET